MVGDHSHLQLRHHFGAHQLERAQRLLKRQIAEEQIGEQIVQTELVGLAFDFGQHRLRAAGDRHAILLPLLEGHAARHQSPHLGLVLGVLFAQPVQTADVVVDIRLGELARLLVGLRHHDVPQRADRRAAFELRLRLQRAATLGQCIAIRVDVDLGVVGRTVGDKMHAVIARPRGAGGVRRAVPECRMRLLQRPQRHRHVLVGIVRARMAERVVGQRGGQAVERIDKDVARFRRGNLVIGEFIRRHPAAHADFEPPVAEMVEDADLLGEPQR